MHINCRFSRRGETFFVGYEIFTILSAFPSFNYRLKNSLFNSFVVFNLIRDFDKLTLT